MVLRKDRGFPGTTFWIRLSQRRSMPNSLIVQLLEPGVDHHVVGSLCPLERAVERGVLSQISQAPPPIPHYDLNHLISDSRHLHPLITQSTQHYKDTHPTPALCPISIIRSGLSTATRYDLLDTYLFRNFPPVPPPEMLNGQ